MFGNEFGIVEVVNLHGATHIVECCCGNFTRIFATALEHIVDGGDVLLELQTALADGLKGFVEDAFEEALALHVAESATCIVLLEFVEVGIVLPVTVKVFVAP